MIGGAIYSAIRYAQRRDATGRAFARGNVMIAIGALLPGIVEALYIGEFLGLLFIWAGYVFCTSAPRPVRSTAEPMIEVVPS